MSVNNFFRRPVGRPIQSRKIDKGQGDLFPLHKYLEQIMQSEKLPARQARGGAAARAAGPEGFPPLLTGGESKYQGRGKV